jgi:hypothetical protein
MLFFVLVIYQSVFDVDDADLNNNPKYDIHHSGKGVHIISSKQY